MIGSIFPIRHRGSHYSSGFWLGSFRHFAASEWIAGQRAFGYNHRAALGGLDLLRVI